MKNYLKDPPKKTHQKTRQISLFPPCILLILCRGSANGGESTQLLFHLSAACRLWCCRPAGGNVNISALAADIVRVGYGPSSRRISYSGNGTRQMNLCTGSKGADDRLGVGVGSRSLTRECQSLSGTEAPRQDHRTEVCFLTEPGPLPQPSPDGSTQAARPDGSFQEPSGIQCGRTRNRATEPREMRVMLRPVMTLGLPVNLLSIGFLMARTVSRKQEISLRSALLIHAYISKTG